MTAEDLPRTSSMIVHEGDLASTIHSLNGRGWSVVSGKRMADKNDVFLIQLIYVKCLGEEGGSSGKES